MSNERDVFLAGLHDSSLTAGDTILSALGETFRTDREQAGVLPPDSPYRAALTSPRSTQHNLLVAWANYSEYDPHNWRAWAQTYMQDPAAAAAALRRVQESGVCIQCQRRLVPIGGAERTARTMTTGAAGCCTRSAGARGSTKLR